MIGSFGPFKRAEKAVRLKAFFNMVVKFRGNEDGRASSWSLRPVEGKSGLWSLCLRRLWAAGGDALSAVLKLALAAGVAGTSYRDEPPVPQTTRSMKEIRHGDIELMPDDLGCSASCSGRASEKKSSGDGHGSMIAPLKSVRGSEVSTTTAIDDSHASTTDCSPSESPRTSAKVEEDNMRLLVHVRDRSFVIRCGPGSQHIRWLANMGIARYCPVYSKRGSTIRSGTPSGVRFEDGTYLDMGAKICEQLKNDDEVWVELEEDKKEPERPSIPALRRGGRFGGPNPISPLASSGVNTP
ncbi:hypothetical protein FOZ61_007444 [Perkinsus olseni]|uniref:Uncharacterized protein n=1 Tax=Perkinsus olseni TaxID=32597 RepID=A0A7J6L929_PEROL|nr:hypothetical protein FOZ61_007444 [Perkinsus olseni]